MVIGVGDLKKGITIELDGEPYQVIEYSSQKMQARAPTVKLKLKELRSGRSIEKAYNGFAVKFNLAAVETKPAQFIYREDQDYYFMDTQTFDQFPIPTQQLGNDALYLKEQMEIDIIFYNDLPISVQLPTFAELEVSETPPSAKGNTAQGGTKPATLETGLVVNLPFFINIGDTIRVDTRTGEYLERVN
jgi:elongation factor P|tara:strand:+ start:40 stop:606 length:567 start_codon:yes stop_codon:yes gene_type:complete